MVPLLGGRGVIGPAVRLVFALLGAVAGYQLGDSLRTTDLLPWTLTGAWQVLFLAVMVVAGFFIGLGVGIVLSKLVRRGLERMDDVLARVSGSEVVVAVAGVIVGLGIAALISLAVVRLPYVGVYLLPPLFLLSVYFTAHLAARKHIEILRLIGVRSAFEAMPGLTPPKLIDSSAVIDGRVIDVVKSGFIEGELLVPRFVIEELQRLADSADAEKRVRGRRGLDLVRRLQNSSGQVRVEDKDYTDIEAVDAKLVRLGGELHAVILTTDYTLNKVAEIQGVRVLNVNDLANSVKSAVLPGELIEVKILREGREQDQGVGYLDDGTMIVVESGASLVGERVTAEVTSVLQSPSGKMIFSRLSQ